MSESESPVNRMLNGRPETPQTAGEKLEELPAVVKVYKRSKGPFERTEADHLRNFSASYGERYKPVIAVDRTQEALMRSILRETIEKAHKVIVGEPYPYYHYVDGREYQGSETYRRAFQNRKYDTEVAVRLDMSEDGLKRAIDCANFERDSRTMTGPLASMKGENPAEQTDSWTTMPRNIVIVGDRNAIPTEIIIETPAGATLYNLSNATRQLFNRNQTTEEGEWYRMVDVEHDKDHSDPVAMDADDIRELEKVMKRFQIV